MLHSVLFFKLSLENFLSQQRETQPHGASEQQSFSTAAERAGSGTQDLVCEWPSVQSGVTMWLIDEKPSLSLLLVPLESLHKGGLSQCPTSRLCRTYTRLRVKCTA